MYSSAARRSTLRCDVYAVIAELTRRRFHYGTLLKFASYLIGHLDGRGLKLDAAPAASKALEGNWFAPAFDRLASALRRIFQNLGNWTSREDFDALGDIAVGLLARSGLEIRRQSVGGVLMRVRLDASPTPAA